MLGRFSLKTVLIAGAMLTAAIPAAVLGVGSARAMRELVISQAMGR